MFEDSFVLVVPLVYFVTLSILVASTISIQLEQLVKTTLFSALALTAPTFLVFLPDDGLASFFGSISVSVRDEYIAAAVSTIQIVFSSLALAVTLWWLGTNNPSIVLVSKLPAIWSCAAALITLFYFGRFIVTDGKNVDPLIIDTLLAVVGTWLITRVVMVWVVGEFRYALEELGLLSRTKVLSALFLAFILLFTIVYGTAIRSALDGRLISHVTYRLDGIPFLIPLVFMIGCISVFLRTVFFRVYRSIWKIFTLTWILVLCYLTYSTEYHASADLGFAIWYAIACGGFCAVGYYNNTTGVPGFAPRQQWTLGWSIYLFASSALCAYEMLSTVANGFLLSIVTCALFVAAQGSIAAIVLRLDLSSPSVTDQTVREAESNGWFVILAKGVCQDAIVGGLIALVFGYIPLITLSQTGPSVSFLSFMVFYSGFVAIGLGFFVVSDLNWLKDKKNNGFIFKETPDMLREQSLTALKKHIQFQVYWALISVLPVALLQWIDSSLDRALNLSNITNNVWFAIDDLNDLNMLNRDEPNERVDQAVTTETDSLGDGNNRKPDDSSA